MTILAWNSLSDWPWTQRDLPVLCLLSAGTNGPLLLSQRSDLVWPSPPGAEVELSFFLLYLNSMPPLTLTLLPIYRYPFLAHLNHSSIKRIPENYSSNSPYPHALFCVGITLYSQLLTAVLLHQASNDMQMFVASSPTQKERQAALEDSFSLYW